MITVSPLCHIERLAAEQSFTRSLSLLAPWQTLIFDVNPLPRDHVILAFNDIAAPEPGSIAPDEAIARTIIEFGLACQSGDRVLVHCWMGVSRSPAAAYIIAAARAPGAESAIAEELRRRSPAATPNRLLVALADSLLQRQGRMVEAIDAIGAGGALAGDAPSFALPLDWGATACESV